MVFPLSPAPSPKKMNSLIRNSPWSIITRQGATKRHLERSIQPAWKCLSASNRQNSTEAQPTRDHVVTSSSTATASSDKPSSRPHLRSAGLAPPKGVIVMPPPGNVLPEKPAQEGYPCPHLTDKQVAEYLFPLYERGWGIYTKLPSDEKPASLMLAKSITFLWHYPLVDLLQHLHSLSKQEKHHPRVHYELRSLEIFLNTHSAIPKEPTEPVNLGRRDLVPGITLRDVRYAYFVEDALQPFYELGKIAQATNKYAQLTSLDIPGLLPQKVNSTEAPSKRCIVCGGDHWSTTCPERFTKKPPNVCELCGGDHWKFACSQYKQWRLSIKKGWADPPVEQYS